MQKKLLERTASLTVQLTGVKEEESMIEPAFSNKYLKIRKRLFDNFYYGGLIAEWVEGDHVKFADQTIYMGQALIFLASEAYLKQKIGADLQPTLDVINEILDEVDKLDQEAETLYGRSGELNGFIIRDNVTGPDDPRLHSRFAVVDSDGQNPRNAAPSGDQIFGLMYGLWFVQRLVQESSIVERVQTLAERLYLYAQQCKFELKLPDGQPVARGADMRWLSSLLHGLNKSITGLDHFSEARIEILGFERRLNDVAAFWDGAGNDIDNILESEIHLPVVGQVSIKSFAAHILLMAIAPSGIWSQDELEAAAMAVNHHLAVLTYAMAHNVTPNPFHFNDVQAILARCPDAGPRSDLPVSTGWQKDNRWIRSRNIDEPGTGHRDYNGVDFLILHNLAQIVFMA